jgi:NAD(P)-dependent dehydrogenase (short-subunit alcohol dehydrogenase family)
MGMLEGRVAVITGGARGLGREHALAFAREGAKIVVNDLGGSGAGEGADATPADEVVAEIKALGRDAIANYESVASWDGAERIIPSAVDAIGALHILVNNAGILRDRMVVNMTESDWDLVIDVHLKGHFCLTRFAAEYWREQSKDGNDLQGRIINTSSPAGLYGNLGQTNYAAAKAGIIAMTETTAMELARYGVKVNCIAPAARTRLTTGSIQTSAKMAAPDDPNQFDQYHPGNLSPSVVVLASVECPFNGQVFQVQGTKMGLCDGWRLDRYVESDSRWEPDQLAKALADFPAEPERRLGVWRPALAQQV